MTTDPEEQRLTAAVVDAARALSFSSMIPPQDSFANAALEAVAALDVYRTRSSSPEPTARVEPPDLMPCPWCGGKVQPRWALWISDGCVDSIIHAAPTDCPMQVFEDGSTDKSIVAKWNTRANAAAMQQLTDEDIDECWRKHWGGGVFEAKPISNWHRYFARAIISKAALTDTRIEPTDEAIDAFVKTLRGTGHRDEVRAVLAHFCLPQEITDPLLLQLRSIALTRDPEVYLTDARKAVGKCQLVRNVRSAT